MTQRSTGGYGSESNCRKFLPSSTVALWSDTSGKIDLELQDGSIGLLLELEKKESYQWAAGGCSQPKVKLFYSNSYFVGSQEELNLIFVKTVKM